MNLAQLVPPTPIPPATVVPELPYTASPNDVLSAVVLFGAVEATLLIVMIVLAVVILRRVAETPKGSQHGE